MAPAMPSYAVMFVTKWATTLVLWAPYTLVLVVCRLLTRRVLSSARSHSSRSHTGTVASCCRLPQQAVLLVQARRPHHTLLPLPHQTRPCVCHQEAPQPRQSIYRSPGTLIHGKGRDCVSPMLIRCAVVCQVYGNPAKSIVVSATVPKQWVITHAKMSLHSRRVTVAEFHRRDPVVITGDKVSVAYMWCVAVCPPPLASDSAR